MSAGERVRERLLRRLRHRRLLQSGRGVR